MNYSLENDLEIAKRFAEAKFKEAGQPNHYLDVLNILQEDFKISDQDILLAGTLHDTLEDTNTTYEELSKKFGKTVADLVLEVSHPKNYSPEERIEYYEKIKTISSKAKYIKLADFASHLSNFIEIYKKGEQHLYPKFKNNYRYVNSIREFLGSCENTPAKDLVKSLVDLFEKYL